jgi:hypothetical protein
VQYCAEQIENDGDPVPAIVKGVKRALAGEQSCCDLFHLAGFWLEI